MFVINLGFIKMKLLNIQQIREADQYTIKNEPISSFMLMKRAAKMAFDYIYDEFGEDKIYFIICGPGNNGGDGVAIASLLLKKECNVKVIMANFDKKLSPDNAKNIKLLEKNKNDIIRYIEPQTTWEEIIPSEYLNEEKLVIIDSLFGSGLSRPIGKEYTNIINGINSTNSVVISIDIPSGLYADKSSDVSNLIVQATLTLTFQVPKLAFLMPENYRFNGEVIVLDIKLHKDYFKNVKTNNYLIDKELCKNFLPARSKFDHKGNFGHALLIVGGYGKLGAALLSTEACLRCGAGRVTALLPKEGINVMHASIPEAMIFVDDLFTSDLSEFNVFAIGPGIGVNKDSLKKLEFIIDYANKNKKQLVIDADGLNLIGQNKKLLEKLPFNTILTPHPKEFERIFGTFDNDFERLDFQLKMSLKHAITIVYKVANTVITTPYGHVLFNRTGNPGMATAGSGDVLTGMITGLTARNIAPDVAAVLGVFLHGLAGDIGSFKFGEESLIASDIIYAIPDAFKVLEK